MKLNLRSYSLLALAGLGVVGAGIAIAEPSKDKMPEMKLPAGWTTEDMQACMVAGMPGKMHEKLAKASGVWQGKCKMWMAPGMDPMMSTCTNTVTAIMDGRYIKSDYAGEMPGMGPFNGLGLTGYDNVSGKFVGTWLDNHSSGIMNGTGEMTGDGKTINWTYNFNCPINKKPTVMRQVESFPNDNTMTLDMFGLDPKSGKEFQMMHIEFTRSK